MTTYADYQQFKNQPRAQAAPAPATRTPTTADILGPFYKAGAPMRDIICAYPTLVLSGRVIGTDAMPIRGALLDFWQANAAGEYDNDTFRLRGKQITNQGGHYRLETMIPGDYRIADDPVEFRCAHIHVIIAAHGFKSLTTQLYFPGAPHNDTDHWFDASRVVTLVRPGEVSFDFILEPEVTDK